MVVRTGALGGLLIVAGVLLARPAWSQTAAAVPEPDATRASYADRTHMTFDSGHGTQVEYLRPDGSAFLWYPGNSAIVPGQWKVETRENPPTARVAVRICFKYGTDTYNPVTRKRGGAWTCGSARSHEQKIVETAAGDVFDLANRRTVPFKLQPQRTTVVDLAQRLKRP
jgi:hypothetical protein